MTKACARCLKKAPPDRLVYSVFTGLRYCVDHAACDRRMARRVRELAKREGVVA